MKRDQRLVYPKSQPYLDRFIRGSVTNSLRCSIAERDLEITHREAIARAARKNFTGRVAQKGEVITLRFEMYAQKLQKEKKLRLKRQERLWNEQKRWS